MNKLVVSVFDTETQAFEGLTAFKELHSNGDLSLYATAVINKDESGEISIKENSDQGPIGTAVAALTGGLVGLFAGPAGAMAGAAAGAFGGMIYDINSSGTGMSYAQNVAIALQEGKTAVVAEIDETWSTPLDTKMDELGAVVFRTNKAAAEYDSYVREDEALNQELDELEQELKEANDDLKESIQKQIAKNKEKHAMLKTAVENKMAHLKSETEAKVATVKEQIEVANDKRKAKLEQRKNDLQQSYTAKKEQLSKLRDKISHDIKREFKTV